MSTAAAQPDRATIPMPSLTEAGLRVAVEHLDLAAAVSYELEFRQAWQEAIQTESTVPMHLFIRKWAIWVELHRFPERAAKIRAYEAVVNASEDRGERRAAAAALGQLIAEAERGVAG